VVFGNVLENALEACRRITAGERFIKLSSQFIGNKLYIAVDNSFSGEIRLKNGVYLSQKREAASGIGIISVMAIAKKYDGKASFEQEDQVFRVSVYLANKSHEKAGEIPTKRDELVSNNKSCQVEH
jgi:sensor histidine kinase regulating citrate/malate metabolism